MATQTTNIGLSKPDYADTADIAVINSNMDTIDSTVNNIEKGIAIVSDGNTHSAIAKGEYVYVRDHSTLAEGLYIASSAIAANGTLTSSNLTARSKGIGGEVASLNDQIATVSKSSDTVSNIESWLVTVGQTINQGSFKNIQFVVSTASGVFKAKTYMGTLMRYGAAVYGVSLLATSPTDFVQGNCINGTWTWNSINDQIDHLQHYQFTCLKNGGKLRFSSSNTTGSWWLIFVGRGTIAADMGGWFAVVGSTSSSLKELYSPGSNLTFAYDSTSQKLTLTNGDTTNDIYVSVIRIFGTGTMTATQA